MPTPAPPTADQAPNRPHYRAALAPLRGGFGRSAAPHRARRPQTRRPPADGKSPGRGLRRQPRRGARSHRPAQGRRPDRNPAGVGGLRCRSAEAINLRFWQGAGPELDELRDIFELRAMVEGAVAELAAQRRDDDDLRAMTEHLQAMDDAMESGVDGTVADDNFHIAMARATHNAYIGRLVEFLGRHFSDSRKLAWHDTSLLAPAAAGLPARAPRLARGNRPGRCGSGPQTRARTPARRRRPPGHPAGTRHLVPDWPPESLRKR
jgi:hypothetical protein